MGGIAGVCSPKAKIGTEIIDRMLSRISHRGPAKRSVGCGENVAFGTCSHDTTGMGVYENNEGKKIWIGMDGEIFSCGNSEELNDGSDHLKILFNLYRKYGERFAEEIDGSYIIALYDEELNRFLLIRDRLGYRPLFYFEVNGGIIFSSEVKALLEYGPIQRRVHLEALNDFLSYSYVPNPETLFEAIRQVKPGHMIVYQDGTLIEKGYWKFTYKNQEDEKKEVYYQERFLELFERVVWKRLRKHPEAGAFLSGGLDTSGVVAMMHKLIQRPFKVFTAGFKEEKYNEIEDARIVAGRFDLDQYIVMVEFGADFPSLLEKIVWHHDAPFADTSAIPSYYAAKLAKEHVDTVLTGDFPDQLIGGSGHHVATLSRLSRDPWIFRMLRKKEINKFVGNLRWSAGGVSLSDRAKRMIYRETFPLEEQRIILSMPVPPLLKRCLYSPDLLKIGEENDSLNVARALYKEVENEDLLNRLLYFDILSYAPDDLMVKVERMTMAHGLNAISPFHDLELVEFIASVPSHLKINGTTRKYIMREALRPLLPEHTLNKRKQGFAMPIGDWLATKMSDYVRDVLLDSKTLNRGYFDKRFMTKMVGDFLTGRTDYASGNEATIISLITLELWHRVFIDG